MSDPTIESQATTRTRTTASVTNTNNNNNHTNDHMNDDMNEVAQQYSPFLNNRLRFSPKQHPTGGYHNHTSPPLQNYRRPSTAATVTASQPSQPPQPQQQHQSRRSTTTTTNTNTTKRFFQSNNNNNNNNTVDDYDDDDLNLMGDNDNTQPRQAETDADDGNDNGNNNIGRRYHTNSSNTNSNSNAALVIDGIPIGQLRTLVQSSLISSPETAAYYCNIIYAKTFLPSDALLLATSHCMNHKYDACLRIIEESQLLQQHHHQQQQQQQPNHSHHHHHHYNHHDDLSSPSLAYQQQDEATSLLWDAVLLAAQALTAKRDYTTLIDLLEDVCRLPSADAATTTATGTANNIYHHPFIQPQQPLEDDDQIGWMTLKRIISSSSPNDCISTKLHPLSLICYYRGLGYHETGCTIRATTYWKLSFIMDVYNQMSYRSLLEKNLLSIQEAYELVTREDVNIQFQTNQIDWLKSLYLSRIELTTTAVVTTTTTDTTAQQQQEDSTASAVMSNNYNINGSNNLKSTESTAEAAIGIGISMYGSTSLDASSIQLSSPIPTFHVSERGIMDDIASNNNAIIMMKKKNDHHYRITDHDEQQMKNTESFLSSSHIQNDIDQAFHNLFHVHGLQNSSQVLAVAARRAYRRYDWKSSLSYCQDLAHLDPTVEEATFCYIATLVMLGHKRVLFRLAHEWVDATPKSARSWFAVGAYYYSIHRYHIAQRHFCRATRMNPQCTEAWIALGCAFASCDESDQALASFRAAQRLSPGEHSSLLYMGMEYIRTNHSVLASHFLQAALSASGGDPLCLHEMGVLAAHKGAHNDAIYFFRQAMSAIGGGGESLQEAIDLCYNVYWEPTVFNLGHSYRKCRQFDNALICFNRCVTLCPERHSAYSALAFTKHLKGEIDDAISCYHKALGLKPDDPFSTEMLSRALQDQITTKTQDIFNICLQPSKVFKSTAQVNPYTRFLTTPSIMSTYKKSDSETGDDMDLDFDMSVTS